MPPTRSPLDAARASYRPRLPEFLRDDPGQIAIEESEAPTAVGDAGDIAERFPRTYGRPILRLHRGPGQRASRGLRVGVVLSGGQAPGGHNVITGLHDGLVAAHPDSRLLGFLGGPRGIFEDSTRELTAELLDDYRNTGGFDLIRSGSDKIETADQLEASRKTCERHELDGLVVIGGDDSNTNAAVLAEYFLEKRASASVIGVPKTIDGDLKSDLVEISFGFDTATKVYSELIGNICRDAKSAGKYWHFIKLMGRSASHVTLECALATGANVALIGEEVEQRGLTLKQIVSHVAELVRKRAEAGVHHGVCLIPEGLIEFIPEMRTLIGELNKTIHENAAYFETIQTFLGKQEYVNSKLTPASSHVFSCLPARIQVQLLLDRDAHGNVQVSKIDTELLVIEEVEEQIAEWKAKGEFSGKFAVQGHFLGYEGRCSAPSNFDANYTYALGRVAAALVLNGKTGYMCGVGNLVAPPEKWRASGIPLTSMMQMEMRKGRWAPVIGKALVRTDREPFLTFAAGRAAREIEDDYRYPGAIQYFGPPEVSQAPTQTLLLERAGSAELPAWLREEG